MKYEIGPRYFGAVCLEIDRPVYDALIAKRRCILSALSMQEKYAYLIENYYELELEIYSAAIRSHNYYQQSLPDRVQTIHSFIRRIVNLLTTTKLYFDQAKSDLRRIDPTSQLLQTFNTSLAGLRASSFSIQLCEALRNHVQHAGLPLSGLSIDTQYPRTKTGPKKPIQYVSLTLERDGLLADRKLNKELQAELTSHSKKIDLRPHIKKYVWAIADLNDSLLPAIIEARQQAQEAICKSIEEYRAKVHSVAADDYIYAFEIDGNDNKRKDSLLSLANDERFNYLRTKYRRISAMKHLMVSNDPYD